MKMAKCSMLVMLILVLAAPLAAQNANLNTSDSTLGDYDFEVDFVNGYLSGGSIAESTVDGEPVTVDTDGGWLTGLRFGADKEDYGFELSVLGAFQNMDLEADPFADVPSVDSATWLISSLNVMLYPTGNDMMDGRFKPFITFGPGLAYLDSDFDKADSELLINANAGAGLKMNIGDTDDIMLRLEYRWHAFLGGSGDMKGSFYRHEISVGLGVQF